MYSLNLRNEKESEMILDIMRKEIKEIRKTKRLLIIGILFVVATIGAAVCFGHFVGGGPNEMLRLGVFGIIFMFVSLLALILAYDTIVGERSRGSLLLVLSKPVGRAQIFAGKFLAIFLFTGVLYLIVSSFGYWLEAVISQEFPSGAEVAAAYKFFFAFLLVIACWISFAMFFSTWFKSSAISLVTALILWILVLPMISKMPLAIYLAQSGEVSFPWWVKLLYAVDPDMCIAELSKHLLEASGSSILTAGQSIAAMVIFIGIFFILGFLLFRRLSLE
jgi:Cu-processing system permease protein